ncbi:solute carrier family 22 member 13-like protein [Lates japonicus]|uniref:Solute carrier family 22 member 13-like protein n=1 Tax=Lates japonicus TaxID=270547 RepID=A0AAD3R4V4_LATJO|nr:solute carrier family 22 member 13-like protein [Lates japonicus]
MGLKRSKEAEKVTTVLGARPIWSTRAGLESFLLPETRRKELPDSTDEAEGNINKTTMKILSASSMSPRGKSTIL